MAGFDIDGSWEGEYSYFPNDAFPVLPPMVRFTLTAQGGWFGSFNGVIQDDPLVGIPDPAAVRGQLKGLSLTFTKRYPAMYIYLDGRSVKMEEYLASEHGMPVDHEVPGAQVLYEGDFDAATESVVGIWHISSKRVCFWSAGELRALDIPAMSGEWKLHRPSPC
jgi:hypothetical protein